MGRTKPRPVPQSGKPQGEQQLSDAAWAQIVKTIRELSSPN
jgi:hypothetical protein